MISIQPTGTTTVGGIPITDGRILRRFLRASTGWKGCVHRYVGKGQWSVVE